MGLPFALCLAGNLLAASCYRSIGFCRILLPSCVMERRRLVAIWVVLMCAVFCRRAADVPLVACSGGCVNGEPEKGRACFGCAETSPFRLPETAQTMPAGFAAASAGVRARCRSQSLRARRAAVARVARWGRCRGVGAGRWRGRRGRFGR